MVMLGKVVPSEISPWGRAPIQGEQVVARFTDLTLTNYRLIDANSRPMSPRFSMTLDSVGTVRVFNESADALLVTAVLLLVGALGTFTAKIEAARTGAAAAALLGVVLLVLYLASRSTVLVLTANNGEKVRKTVKAAERNAAMNFVDAVEATKLTLLDHHR